MDVSGDQGRGGQGRAGKAKGSQGKPGEARGGQGRPGEARGSQGKGGRRPEDKKVIFNEGETKKNHRFFERDSKVEFQWSRRGQGRSG